MRNINYYVPNSDKVIIKEKVIGEGTITVIQGETTNTFGVNDIHNSTIEISPDLTDYLTKNAAAEQYVSKDGYVATSNDYTNADKQVITKLTPKTDILKNVNTVSLTFEYADESTETIDFCINQSE